MYYFQQGKFLTRRKFFPRELNRLGQATSQFLGLNSPLRGFTPRLPKRLLTSTP